MLDFPQWKVWAVTLPILIGILLAIPSMMPASAGAPSCRAGCPTRGSISGSTSPAAATCCSRPIPPTPPSSGSQPMEEEVTTELRRGEPRIEIGDVSTAGGRLSFMVRDPAQVDAAVERMRALTQPVALTGSATGTSAWSIRPASC